MGQFSSFDSRIRLTRDRVFLGTSALFFIANVATTIEFCQSMSGGMAMPGGWTMSMAWMRMQGQSWLGSAVSYVRMWVVMMAAMMLPALVPTLLGYRLSLRGRDTIQPERSDCGCRRGLLLRLVALGGGRVPVRCFQREGRDVVGRAFPIHPPCGRQTVLSGDRSDSDLLTLVSVWAPETLNRIGCISLRIGASPFALEPVICLDATTSLVLKWLLARFEIAALRWSSALRQSLVIFKLQLIPAIKDLTPPVAAVFAFWLCMRFSGSGRRYA